MDRARQKQLEIPVARLRHRRRSFGGRNSAEPHRPEHARTLHWPRLNASPVTSSPLTLLSERRERRSSGIPETLYLIDEGILNSGDIIFNREFSILGEFRGHYGDTKNSGENSGDTILNSPCRVCAASNFRADRGQAKDLRTEKPALSIPLAWIARGNLYPHFLSHNFLINLTFAWLKRGTFRTSETGAQAGVVEWTGSDEPGRFTRPLLESLGRMAGRMPCGHRAGDDPGRGRAETSGWCR